LAFIRGSLFSVGIKMGYHVYITRKATGWDDATDEATISLAEWQEYVTNDPEMQVDEITNPVSRTSQPTDWDLMGASIWVPYSKNGRGNYYARFVHQDDCIVVAQPDEEILGKMLLVAYALQARVQGDDGEYFDEYNAQPVGAAQTGSTWAEREFRDFQTFASAEAAQPLLAALERQGIAALTAFDNGQVAFDPSFANNQLTSKFTVKLALADFEQASQVLADLDKDALSQANPNHYLFTFSDEELFDLLVKPDEWSSFDVALASQLLRKRGRDISPDTLKLLRQHRVAKLAEPDRDHTIWIRSGYVSALLGGLLGFFIGYHLYAHRNQLPDGRRVYAYSPKDRVHGLRIMTLGAIMLLLFVGLRVFQEMNR
jgi:hypothetical protein